MIVKTMKSPERGPPRNTRGYTRSPGSCWVMAWNRSSGFTAQALDQRLVNRVGHALQSIRVTCRG